MYSYSDAEADFATSSSFVADSGRRVKKLSWSTFASVSGRIGPDTDGNRGCCDSADCGNCKRVVTCETSRSLQSNRQRRHCTDQKAQLAEERTITPIVTRNSINSRCSAGPISLSTQIFESPVVFHFPLPFIDACKKTSENSDCSDASFSKSSFSPKSSATEPSTDRVLSVEDVNSQSVVVVFQGDGVRTFSKKSEVVGAIEEAHVVFGSRPCWTRMKVWKLTAWLGIVVAAFGIIGLLITRFMPRKQFAMFRKDTRGWDVFYMEAEAFNGTLNVLELASLFVLCVGGAMFMIAVLLPSLMRRNAESNAAVRVARPVDSCSTAEYISSNKNATLARSLSGPANFKLPTQVNKPIHCDA